MAKPQIIKATSAGKTAGVAIDLTKFRAGIGLVVGISENGSATYTVEAAGDRTDVADGSKLWVALPLLKSKTVATLSNLSYPVTAVRLNVDSVTGTLQLAVVYAD